MSSLGRQHPNHFGLSYEFSHSAIFLALTRPISVNGH